MLCKKAVITDDLLLTNPLNSGAKLGKTDLFQNIFFELFKNFKAK